MPSTVFLSYSKDYASQTRELANFLEGEGYKVWWDVDLNSGEYFREVIQDRLNEAAIVIVIWTPGSIHSRWVASEADHADRLGKLITLRTQDVAPHEIPLPYNCYHAELLENRAAIVKALGAALNRRQFGKQDQPESSARFKVITGKREVKRAFKKFVEKVEAVGERFPAKLGHLGANWDTEVIYNNDAGFWCLAFENNDNDHFGICFGQGAPKPESQSTNIIVAMNVPHEGENVRLGGVFLKDDMGRPYIGHTGRLGGGRPGIGMAAFKEHTGITGWVQFERQDRMDEALVFGPLDSPNLINQLAEFVAAVKEFKAEAAE